jgi:hypothetical protein
VFHIVTESFAETEIDVAMTINIKTKIWSFIKFSFKFK